MIRLCPCELPRVCGTGNCSSNKTLLVVLEREYAAELPTTPAPITQTSYNDSVASAMEFVLYLLPKVKRRAVNFVFQITLPSPSKEKPHT